MIFARGEVDKSKENYEVTTEVFFKGETSQIFCEYEAIGREIIRNMDSIPKEFYGIFAEQMLKSISNLGESLVEKYQEVSKE